MKKWMVVFSLVILVFALSGCGSHEHSWKEATYTEPKTCSECGATEGNPLDPETKESEKPTSTTPSEGELVELETEEDTDESFGELAVDPITFSGSGDQVLSKVSIAQRMYKVTLKNVGSSNFIVHAYTAEGDRLGSLANEIGNYEGSVILTDNIDGGIIEVKSSGSWTITFDAIPNDGTSNITGIGNQVSPWFTLDSGALVVTLSNDGESNFIVHLYDEDGKRYSSLANEIGSYNGTTVFNKGQSGMKYCIEVDSDGTWSVDFGLEKTVTKVTN